MSESSIAVAGADVVLCYCDADASFCNALSAGLDSLCEERVISRWRQHRVSSDAPNGLSVGDSFQVVLVLLSPEFIATGFLEQEEFLAHLEDRDGGRLAVIPVLARPVQSAERTLNYNVPPPVDSCALSESANVADAVGKILARIRDVSKSSSRSDVVPQTLDRTVQLAKDLSDPASKAEIAPKAELLPDAPERIGRYKIVGVLGEGAFGAVYLAQDEQLARPVAIKTPHKRRVSRPSDIESYMREARMVAQLDHPGIVPVYDVGRTDDGQFFVVSKVIDGKDLSKRLRSARPSLIEAARLVALVAEALHYAHQRDLVHRDIKPANILIGEADSRPYVADFGLAIHEDELGQGPTRAGTPAYMSPEQARGEGHRVDGRSDVFSLGVVLYELITGRLPFRKQNIEELLAQIAKSEARPPRQIEASIPRELERICLKAMSNRIMDRYTTAQDFAEDLWFFINSGPAVQSSGFRSSAGDGSVRDSGGTAWEGAASAAGRSSVSDPARRSSSAGRHDSMTSSRRGQATPAPGSTGHASSARGRASKTTRAGASASTVAFESRGAVEAGPAKVVAKGLRAFDDHDADFFLELVPGPRDRYGLPDILRFWKTRLEELNPEKTFPVGVIYGPSGCGKTSLVRAGLLPQLSPHVHVIFLDATARDTESRLAQKVKELCADASPSDDLPALMAWIRRGRGIPYERKLVVVIDQFEQWLQAHENDRGAELLDALRQCDGARVQCVLMVRVDFMMSIHRFMNELEAPIREGANSAPVDLFDAMHAQKVLKLFGASYGRLPEDPEPVDAASQAFLDQAVAELGPDGKIVPVHLALFAEMCKGRPWRPETLKQVGGARGIGVKFLEETFEASTAPLEHRVHEKACRAVLKSLLPEAGCNIRGQARDRDELAQVAGYKPDSREFEALLGVLDRDTRLITPVEHEATADAATCESDSAAVSGKARYQLTHDYLVPSLREWLTKKQRETARGRAQLKLDEFAQLWNDKPVRQRLPGMVDWLRMRTLTRPAEWTTSQRKMMTAAGRRLGAITALAAGILLCLGIAGREINERFKAQRIAGGVEQLATAEIASVPEIVSTLAPARSAAAPLLQKGYSSQAATSQGRVNTALAALSLGVGGPETDHMIDDVYAAMRRASPDDLAVMAASLPDHRQTLGDRASEELLAANHQTSDLLPIASLVAAFRPKVDWKMAAREAVAMQLVSAPADSIGGWVRQLRPARGQLVKPLQVVFEDVERPATQRNIAGDLLVAFAPEEADERIQKLVDLLEHSTDANQFKRIVQQLVPMATPAGEVIITRLAELAKLASGMVGVEREALALRQMYLVAGLLRLGDSMDGWKAFQHSAEPTVRSLLVENLHALGFDPARLIERLKNESDLSIRRALLLCLGGYEKGQLEQLDLSDFSKSIAQWSVDADAGLHAAASWLSDQWTAAGLIEQTVEAAPRNEQAALSEKADSPTWYATGEHHDLVIFRGPLEFEMGSPANDPDREGGALDPTELRHPVRIPRSFAISTKEVTVEQFLAAWPDLRQRKEFFDAEGKPIEKFPYDREKAPEPNCPAINIEWFTAAAYCNWLSQREGIPSDQWCYSPSELFQHRMVLPKDYLTRTGYRLPNEAEWEYACRSGASAGRFFGECPSLLPKYAWYLDNGEGRTWPVGRLKPNEFGLFDVYGNVAEWCLDEPRRYTAEVYNDVEAQEQGRLVDVEKLRVLRGGAFQYVPAMVTSAARDRADPDYDYFSNGFRVARTLPAATPQEK